MHQGFRLMRSAWCIKPVISGTGGKVVEQLRVEQDCNEVRKERARQLYYRLVNHAHCYDQAQLKQLVLEIRTLSPWYGMIAQRHLSRRRREDQENKEKWARIKSQREQQRRRNAALVAKTLGGCAPIKDWPPECRTKKTPRGRNWSGKPARTTQSLQDGPKPPEA